MKLYMITSFFISFTAFSFDPLDHTIDYTFLWENYRANDQKDLNACHSYALTAALEARYYKDHGKKVYLSSMDLFMTHMTHLTWVFKSKGFFFHPFQNFLVYQESDTLEGSSIQRNLYLVKKYGVYEEKDFPQPDSYSQDYLVIKEAIEKNRAVWNACRKHEENIPRNANYLEIERERKILAKKISNRNQQRPDGGVQ